MKILGIGSPFLHDPAAALLVDGEIVAAAEEERFSRHKHATRAQPIAAARYCLEAGGLDISQVDCVAFPWSPKSYLRDLPSYLKRTWWTRPSRAFKALRNLRSERQERARRTDALLEELGARKKPPVEWVDHHTAHAASSYHLSGFENAAILSVDGSGEFTSTFMAEGREGDILPLRRIINPDSLGFFYSTVTEYLGFRRDDGEFKTMGMSAYGDPGRIDVSSLIEISPNGAGSYRINDENIWCLRRKRWHKDKMFGPGLVEQWGPPRTGDGLREPYMHIAAAAQKVLEDITLSFLDTTLKPILERCQGRLCLAGGCALNVRMNRKLLAHPLVEELWVQPAAHDSGAPLGAAVWVAHRSGDRIRRMGHAY
ncbi:MAG: carbamoyltransferase N-terminal domain-containing protein, partial [Planctomycetota bacterium]